MKLKIINDSISHDQKYNGTINITGAKNSALPIIASCALIDEEVTLYNIPNIKDIDIMLKLLTELGKTVSFSNNKVTIKGKINKYTITNIQASSLRSSYYFYSALLSKFKHVYSFLPGGCNLGSRPINFHLDAFKSFGCNYIIFDNNIEIIADKLASTTINFPSKSVGATINAIILAVMISGTTIINNPSLEVEVLDLINFLNLSGAKIIIRKSFIKINGVSTLNKVKYKIMPDRIEAGSYMFLALTPAFEYLKIKDVNIFHLTEVVKTIKKIGAKLYITKNSITVYAPKKITPISIESAPYPGFPTDLIQVLAVILSQSQFESSITDKIFTNRYNYLDELKKLNINVRFTNDSYFVSSSKINNSATLKCSDLRASFALFASSFLTSGTFTLENVDYIFRGYSDFLNILDNLNIKYYIS